DYAYSLDPYNNKTEIKEFDYGGADLLRRTRIDYETGSAYVGSDVHIRNLPTQESLFDRGGTERSRTTYEYDNYASDGNRAPLLERSDATALDSAFALTTYTTRGNLTRLGRWLDTTNTSIYSYRQYDVAANVVRSIDGRGYATTSEYNDRFGTPDGTAQANTPPPA